MTDALTSASSPRPRHPFRPDRPELISVIIPSFNRADLIVETLDSVAAQTWRRVEIIVVDDGSTDQSCRVVEAWRAAHPACELRLLIQRNRGAAAARNLGAKEARGAFLYFLDSDDLVLPHALAMLVAPLLAGPAPFSLAHIRSTDLAGRPLADFGEGLSHQSAGNCFASGWLTHAALYRRSTFAIAGPFDDRLRRGEDSEHQWRVLDSVGPGSLINAFIGVRRIHDRGHLCVHRTAEQSVRDGIAALSRFLDWAARNNRTDALDRRSLFLRAAALSVRAGHAGDWSGHAEAMSLITGHGDSSTIRGALTAILALRSRWMHGLLMLALVVLKTLRAQSTFRSVGRATWDASQPLRDALRTRNTSGPECGQGLDCSPMPRAP